MPILAKLNNTGYHGLSPYKHSLSQDAATFNRISRQGVRRTSLLLLTVDKLIRGLALGMRAMETKYIKKCIKLLVRAIVRDGNLWSEVCHSLLHVLAISSYSYEIVESMNTPVLGSRIQRHKNQVHSTFFNIGSVYKVCAKFDPFICSVKIKVWSSVWS